MAIGRVYSEDRAKMLIQKMIEYACKEIQEHGLESLYCKGQKIRSATITIRIEPDAIATVTYEKEVNTEPIVDFHPYEVVRTTNKNVESEEICRLRDLKSKTYK